MPEQGRPTGRAKCSLDMWMMCEMQPETGYVELDDACAKCSAYGVSYGHAKWLKNLHSQNDLKV